MLFLQLIVYCLLFVLLVKCAAGNTGLTCLYFYPSDFIDEAQRRGLASKAVIMKKGKRFMVFFCLVMLLALLAILCLWNRVSDFKAAYVQCALLLVVTNWFDGIVVDRFWVGHSRLWVISGMEGVPYVKPWKTVLSKRALATIVYLVLSLPIAALSVALSKALYR